MRTKLLLALLTLVILVAVAPALIAGKPVSPARDEVPVLLAHFKERDARVDAGVVDEDVQATQRLRHPVHHLLDLLHARHVARDESCARARLPHLCGDTLGGRPVVEIVDADVGAIASKRDRHAASDPLLGTGDQRHLSVEPSYRNLPSAIGRGDVLCLSPGRVR